MLFYENQGKFTVQNCLGDSQAQLLKTNCISGLNSKLKSTKLTYSFKNDTEIHNHFAAPIQLQILGKKLQNTNLSYKRTFNISISSLMRRKNYSESSYEKFNMLHCNDLVQFIFGS